MTMSERSRYRRKSASAEELEATLFGCIATLDELSRSFEEGLVEATVYKKQNRSLLKDAFKARQQLESKGFQLQEFLEREKIAEKYPRGARAMRLLEGGEEIEGELGSTMPFDQMKRLPEQVADFVSNAIELTDMLRLRTVARVEFLLPALDAMAAVIEKYPGFGQDSSMHKEMKDWIQILEKKRASDILDEKMAENLELNTTRWLNEFRRNLRQ